MIKPFYQSRSWTSHDGRAVEVPARRADRRVGMRAGDCRFHVKRKYGQCWRTHDGQKLRPEHPNDAYNRCDGRDNACPKAGRAEGDEMIKYFHELTEREYKALVEKKQTWAEFAKDYPQPAWCSYPSAVCGVMGCWSLMGFMVKDEGYCKNCDLYKPAKVSAGREGMR